MITQCLYNLDYHGDKNSQRMYKVGSLVGDEATTLSTDDYSSSSFWKGTLPSFCETIDIDHN